MDPTEVARIADAIRVAVEELKGAAEMKFWLDNWHPAIVEMGLAAESPIPVEMDEASAEAFFSLLEEEGLARLTDELPRLPPGTLGMLFFRKRVFVDLSAKKAIDDLWADWSVYAALFFAGMGPAGLTNAAVGAAALPVTRFLKTMKRPSQRERKVLVALADAQRNHQPATAAHLVTTSQEFDIVDIKTLLARGVLQEEPSTGRLSVPF